ncbi:hypothetical protein AMATHDRAFT_55144 [Amanita thiersii Skay4041]|uniref:Palmitoyltransferase n=1 Tax=Amanita thiersii Skay4041 TaxID=703135 RepID=A0A2A9NT87_9AGAR|nr:hypothetical protein AMATHDRAFT_55144 [Amanita thiersii Skay4041]
MVSLARHFNKPLLSFQNQPITHSLAVSSSSSHIDPLDLYSKEPRQSPKKWYHFLPLCVVVALLLAPHPSIIITITNYYILTLHKPFLASCHLVILYLLMFLIFSSLLVCVVRDPGSVRHHGFMGDDMKATDESEREALRDTSDSEDENMENGAEIGLSEALMSGPSKVGSPEKWCKKCMALKPERTHHCSMCGRCVLKMDHHCPWLGSNCVGHRTYPAFVHFLCGITIFSTYVAIMSAYALWYSFSNPYDVDVYTPIHEMCLALAGIVFALVIGSFFSYHIYLILTNQTTLENISPFLLLRHLPSLPLPHEEEQLYGHRLSEPPKEHELSYKQRMLVKDAHHAVRIYDVGWRRNVGQVFGVKGVRPHHGWVRRLWYGGSSPGDGRHFPRNPGAEELLARLARELMNVDIDR